MNPKLSVGVDEFTAVLSADKAEIRGLEGWAPKAERMIEEFTGRANLERAFGKQKGLEGRAPQGYTVAYQYGDNPFYFAAAYHPLRPDMGVAIKFSAHSWAAYREKEHTDVRRFLRLVQSESYHVRLSRIDLAADYFDWGFSVDDVYQGLVSGRLEIRDHKGEANHSGLAAYAADGKAGTFYVGSRKAGTRLFLRVYDKKAEQTEKKGFRLREALGAKSWARFEAAFKGAYAHQLTGLIQGVNEGELDGFIAGKITEKYRFHDAASGAYADFTAALLDMRGKRFPCLHLESPRDNDLMRSFLHLANGSGLFPALYKCDEIWGDGAGAALLECLHGIYADGYEPNGDALAWLRKHKGALETRPLAETLALLKASWTKGRGGS